MHHTILLYLFECRCIKMCFSCTFGYDDFWATIIKFIL